MKAAWVYRFTLTDGRTIEADVVRTRTTPYTQVQVDLYSTTEAVRLRSQVYRSLAEALLGMRLGVKQYSSVLEEAPVTLRRYEPEDGVPLFSHTREHIAKWCAVARAHIGPLAHEAEWSEIGEDLEAVNVMSLRGSTSAAVVEAHGLLVRIVKKLTDILIWELRQRRAMMLDPTVTLRRTYTRSIQSVVSNLAALKHLAPYYAVLSVEATPPRGAEVIDMFAWKRARNGTG
jgi:hypothetical protein